MRWRFVLAVLTFAGGTLAAQTPLFRSTVNLVPVDVVVTDQDDRPITDLTAADFTLTQDGRAQQIQTFQYISIPVAHRSVDPKQPQTPPADVATNAPASANSRLWVIIIDDQHIIENDVAHVKEVLTAFVQDLPEDDEVAIVFTSRSDLSVNFTHDASRLLKSLDGVKGALGFGIDAHGNDQGGHMKRNEVASHARITVDAMQQATTALLGSGHSRRTIVLVSGFSPLVPGGGCSPILQLELEEAYSAARAADVPIYTLDPRGIPNDESASRKSAKTIAPCTGGVAAQQSHLRNIAESTGGRAFMNNRDVPSLVRDVVVDNSSFYLLGYAPAPAVEDGKVHPIRVTVSRPGAKIRGRTEYLAPSATTSTTTTTQQALDAALGRAVNVSGLTLHAFASPIAATAKGMTTVVTIDVTYPALGAPHKTVTDDLKVSVLALDADAKVKASVGHDWHVSGMAGADRAMTVRIDEVLDLPPQLLTLRVGVASPALGREGTLQLPLDVPNPRGDKLQIGGVAIGLARDRTLASGFDRVRPLVPFQPTTERSFTLADTVRVFAPIFWSTKDASVDVTITASGGRTGTPQQVTLRRSPGTDSHASAVLDVNVPLKELAPGSCAITVTARLAGGMPVSRAVPCTVEPLR